MVDISLIKVASNYRYYANKNQQDDELFFKDSMVVSIDDVLMTLNSFILISPFAWI